MNYIRLNKGIDIIPNYCNIGNFFSLDGLRTNSEINSYIKLTNQK